MTVVELTGHGHAVAQSGPGMRLQLRRVSQVGQKGVVPVNLGDLTTAGSSLIAKLIAAGILNLHELLSGILPVACLRPLSVTGGCDEGFLLNQLALRVVAILVMTGAIFDLC